MRTLRSFLTPCIAFFSLSALAGCAVRAEEAATGSDEATEATSSEARASLTGKYEATSVNGWGSFNKLELKSGGAYVATTTRMCLRAPCLPLVENGRFTLSLPGRGLSGSLKLDPTGSKKAVTHRIEIGKDGFTLFTPNRVGQATFAREKPACVVGGCSSEICVEQGGPTASICIWREEFACYPQHGVCERDASTGACGWRQTEELESCITAANEPYCNLVDCMPGTICSNEARACLPAE